MGYLERYNSAREITAQPVPVTPAEVIEERAFYSDMVSPLRTLPAPTGFYIKDFLGVYGEGSVTNSWVYSCVRSISEAIGQVPLKFYRTRRSGALQEVDDHPLVELMTRVNDFMTRSLFMESISPYMELGGNAFWVLEKNRTQITPVRPDLVKFIPKFAPNSRRIVDIEGIEVSIDKDTVTFGKDEFVHSKYMSPWNTVWGLPPLSAARLCVISEWYARNFDQKFFQQGASPSGVFYTEGILPKDETERLRTDIEHKYTGLQRSHRPLLLQGGLKWQQMMINQKDAQFLQLRRLNKNEILAIFRVPPLFVMDLDSSSVLQNTPEQRRIFWVDSVGPRLRRYADYINEFLVPLFDAQRKIFAMFDVSEIEPLREDAKLKSDIADKDLRNGTISPNESRRMRRLSEIDEPWADAHYMQNMTPVSQLMAGKGKGNAPAGDGEADAEKIGGATAHVLIHRLASLEKTFDKFSELN